MTNYRTYLLRKKKFCLFLGQRPTARYLLFSGKKQNKNNNELHNSENDNALQSQIDSSSEKFKNF